LLFSTGAGPPPYPPCGCEVQAGCHKVACAKDSRLRLWFVEQKAGRPAKGKSPKITKKVSLSLAGGRRRGGLLTGSCQFIINASQPASDKIFDVSAFEKFLHDRIKVDGRTGNLGDVVQISQAGDGKIEVVAHQEFSGRYLKYL
jgi:hypothetical protein